MLVRRRSCEHLLCLSWVRQMLIAVVASTMQAERTIRNHACPELLARFRRRAGTYMGSVL